MEAKITGVSCFIKIQSPMPQSTRNQKIGAYGQASFSLGMEARGENDGLEDDAGYS